MMKRLTALLLVLTLILTCAVTATAAQKNSKDEEEGWTTIKGKVKTSVKLKKYADNPVIEGMNSLTGLEASGEAYTPILMVLDNTPEAQPHWGVRYADILFQIPNQGGGNTKMLALFANEYPEMAGGARSGRAQMLPLMLSWDTAFAYAGGPPLKKNSNENVEYLLSKWGISKEGKKFNLLSGEYTERVKWYKDAHNLSVNLKEIHEDLIENNVKFEERPFKFTDEPRTEGETANHIKVLCRSDAKDPDINMDNSCKFDWDEEKNAYIRSNMKAVYKDRDTDEALLFNNVIVLRCTFDHQGEYMHIRDHMIGNGTAEIFQNGKYVQGAWKRVQGGRIVLVNPDGSELEMQRGKSFIVVTNANTYVRYQE